MACFCICLCRMCLVKSVNVLLHLPYFFCSIFFLKCCICVVTLVKMFSSFSCVLSLYIPPYFTFYITAYNNLCVFVPVAKSSPKWSTQRWKRTHGAQCSRSWRLCTRVTPAASTTGSSPCWRNTAATGRTTSHSWRTSPVSCSVSPVLTPLISIYLGS